MNLKLIDRVIESYRSSLDEADVARLEFFQGLWEEMDRWSGGPVSAASSYELPSEEDIRSAWDEARPIFSFAAPKLDEKRFLAIFDNVRGYVVSHGGFPEEQCEELSGIDLAACLEGDSLDMAASFPETFLNGLCDTLVEKGYEKDLAYTTALMAMLSLRVELEPVARKLKQLLPGDGESVSHPLACPVCGCAPALAKIGGADSPTDGRGRTLYCEQCATTWDFERIRCARCGTRNQSHLHYFNVEGDDAHRIATCDECGSYIRSVFVGDTLMPFSFEIEEVVTARLDAIASDPRFHVESLKESVDES